jgi:hypothetical protein
LWRSSGIVLGALLVVSVLRDVFETVVLPRRASRRFRITLLFYRSTWLPWRAFGRRIKAGNRRENMLSVYGPLSLLMLLVAWAASLIFGFGLVHWGLGTKLQAPKGANEFISDFYYSGTTLLTLGLGDIFPTSTASRFVTLLEAGTGFAFLALVIGYLPTLAQSFSRRELQISLLDARAGSPCSAAELLRRHLEGGGCEELARLLAEWERWAADLVETHVSFPVLAYYRSQHNNQSWVAALTMILDVCAIIVAGLEDAPVRPARLTFAMARHAAVDLCLVLRRPPLPFDPERVGPAQLARLRAALTAAGLSLPSRPDVDERLAELRQLYEPFMQALGRFLLMSLPPLLPPPGARDNWQTTA